MSIQSNLNQALAVAGVAYSQTSAHKSRQAELEAKRAINERKNTIQKIVGKDNDGKTLEITEHPELFKGQEGLEKSIALDEADKKYVEAHEALASAKPTQKNIEALAHRKVQSEIRHNQRAEMLSYSQEDSEYVKEAIEREKANAKAEAKRQSKVDQMKPYENFGAEAKEQIAKALGVK